MTTKVSRRGLLTVAGVAAAATAAGCAPKAAPSSSSSTSTTDTSATGTSSADVSASTGASSAATKPTLSTTKVVVMSQVKAFTKDDIAKIKADAGIDIQVLEFDQTRLNAMMAAGNPPDVIKGSGVAQTPAIALKGLGRPIDDYIATSDIIKTDDIATNEDCWLYDTDKLKQGEGKRYGMSVDYSQDYMLWGNKDMYEAAGITMATPDKPFTHQQVLDNAAKMTKRSGGRTTQYGLFDVDTIFNFQYLQWVLSTYGKTSVADDSKSVDFTSTEAVQLFDWWQQLLVNKYGPFSVTDPNPDGWSYPPFSAKKMANMNYGLWALGGLTAKDRQFARFMPAYSWGPTRVSPCQSATGYWIPAKAKNPYGGFKFIEWYCAGNGAIARTKAGGGLTSLKSNMQYLPQNDEMTKGVMAVQNNELQYMKFVNMSTPYLDGWAINDVFMKNAKELAKGTQKPADFAKVITDKTNAALQDAIKRFG